jgi:hypothetical protein
MSRSAKPPSRLLRIMALPGIGMGLAIALSAQL